MDLNSITFELNENDLAELFLPIKARDRQREGRQVIETITTADGYSLGARCYRSDVSPRPPLVIIASAMAVKQNYYSAFAEYLCDNGFDAITFDYRGIGRSRPESLKNFRGTMYQWGEQDLAAVIRWAKEQQRYERVLLIGHSAAGQVFPLAANNNQVDAACFIGTVSGYWRHWRGAVRLKIWMLWHLIIPLTTALLGYFPGKLLGNAEDLPSSIARQWARWGRHRDYILSASPLMPQKFLRVRQPLRFLTFSDDALFGLHNSARVLQSWYGNAATEYLHVRPQDIGVKSIGHFGFFRKKFADTLWVDMLEWLRRY